MCKKTTKSKNMNENQSSNPINPNIPKQLFLAYHLRKKTAKCGPKKLYIQNNQRNLSIKRIKLVIMQFCITI